MSIKKKKTGRKHFSLILHMEKMRRLFRAEADDLTAPATAIKQNVAGKIHVLVLPGFMASDDTMEPMLRRLRAIGFNAHETGLGRNHGAFDLGYYNRLKSRLQEVYRQNGGEKISLVGWSLGGVYARRLAHECPDMVRSVIALGSPLSAVRDGVSETALGGIPFSSLYSQRDGIVNYRLSRVSECATTENIEVGCTHVGMVVSSEVMSILVDRLKQDPKKWQKLPPRAPRRYPQKAIGKKK